MKKYTLLTLLILMIGSAAMAQPPAGNKLPEFQVNQREVETMLRFLASDELKGRRTGSQGNDIAARYIAANLEACGFRPAPGKEDFFQTLPLEVTQPPQGSSMELNKVDYAFREDYIILAGDAADLNTTAVFAGHGWVDEAAGINDYEGLDVAGKVVFVLSGRPDANDPRSVFNAMSEKQQIAGKKGAVGLIEIYNLQNFPWEFFKRYFGGETMRVAAEEAPGDGNPLVYGWIKNIGKEEVFAKMKEGKKVKISLSSSGFKKKQIGSHNVIGVLEGSDPGLRGEYVLLTAHFDHVGVGRQGGGATTEQDSIFNGARDNAMGTIALLTAARSLAQQQPRRSVIALAVTGEELGLLGSTYYAEHPLIPLEQTVFNLNTDGAGYNDTRYLSVIGFGRTGTDEIITQAASTAGLEVFPDPAPEQGLFDRSDNVAFAKKGIPALTISPGFTSFDEEIGKYYHQVTDEADSVDMAYFLRFCQAYAYLARLVADREERPQWKAGDKYEEAGKKLYQMN